MNYNLKIVHLSIKLLCSFGCKNKSEINQNLEKPTYEEKIEEIITDTGWVGRNEGQIAVVLFMENNKFSIISSTGIGDVKFEGDWYIEDNYIIGKLIILYRK